MIKIDRIYIFFFQTLNSKMEVKLTTCRRRIERPAVRRWEERQRGWRMAGGGMIRGIGGTKMEEACLVSWFVSFLKIKKNKK